MTTSKAKPFLKWVGGKGQLLPTFSTLLPPELKEREFIYVEPFIGGGAMLFFMLQTFPQIKHAVISDLNPRLVNTYLAVKNDVEMLIVALQCRQDEYYAISSEEDRKAYFLDVRQQFNTQSLSLLEEAEMLIFLNKTCFNGLYRVNAKGDFNVPFGRYANPTICDAETLRADHDLLQKVDILHGDFEQTAPFISEESFVYFDPPYRPLDATSNFNSYAKEVFNDDAQIRLKLFTDYVSQQGALWMLSNADCKAKCPHDDFFDDLYKDYHIDRVQAKRSVNAVASKRGKLNELLISNFVKTTHSLFQIKNNA